MNGNGRYDPDVGPEQVQKIGLGDLTPRALTQVQEVVDGKNGNKITGITDAPSKYPGFSLTLTLHMFGEFLTLEGTTLEPTSMKFDILIQGFPFKEQDTSLALYAKAEMESEGKASTEVEQGEEAIAAKAGKYVSFFSWGTGVTVDGRAETIKQAVMKQEDKRDGGKTETVSEIYLLYPRGNSILHDPKLGVRLASAAGGGFGCNR